MTYHRKFKERQLLIASNNQDKINEINKLILQYNNDVEVIAASKFSIPSPEEIGTTFKANADLKARYYASKLGIAALSDDSGLMVDYLNGEPGVLSARWGGITKNFNLAMDKIEKRLLEQGYTSSPACFVCSLSLCWLDGHIENFEGRIYGKISFPKRGNNGFGYDPIFIPNGYHQSFAELDSTIKNQISHRAQAFKLMMEHCFK